MGLKFLKGERWADVTREERVFCMHLHNRIVAAGTADFVQYSHAIRKGPLLPPNAGATAALFAPEKIAAREPGADERALASRVLAALPFARPPLYARVDLLRDGDGQPVLLELELAEPSLFFEHAPGSVARFVDALVRAGTRPGLASVAGRQDAGERSEPHRGR